MLEVFAKVRHQGKPHLMLVLPDGSRSYIPTDWTDWVPSVDGSAVDPALVASAADLLRLRQRVDWLLRRIQDGSASSQISSNPESPHATATTGTVECGAPLDSTGLFTTHAATARRVDQSLGSTHSEDGPGTFEPSDSNPTNRRSS